MQIKSAGDLNVYRQAYALAMEIFHLSKVWPKEEKYALTDQVLRSSRAVCANLREAWAKRRYEAHFIAKLSECDGENGETEAWLDFACDCQYLSPGDHVRLIQDCKSIGSMLGAMLKPPAPFILHADKNN